MTASPDPSLDQLVLNSLGLLVAAREGGVPFNSGSRESKPNSLPATLQEFELVTEGPTCQRYGTRRGDDASWAVGGVALPVAV